MESSFGKQRFEASCRHSRRFDGGWPYASLADRIRDSPEHNDYSRSAYRNRYCSRNMHDARHSAASGALSLEPERLSARSNGLRVLGSGDRRQPAGESVNPCFNRYKNIQFKGSLSVSLRSPLVYMKFRIFRPLFSLLVAVTAGRIRGRRSELNSAAPTTTSAKPAASDSKSGADAAAACRRPCVRAILRRTR